MNVSLCGQSQRFICTIPIVSNQMAAFIFFFFNSNFLWLFPSVNHWPSLASIGFCLQLQLFIDIAIDFLIGITITTMIKNTLKSLLWWLNDNWIPYCCILNAINYQFVRVMNQLKFCIDTINSITWPHVIGSVITSNYGDIDSRILNCSRVWLIRLKGV